jgi:hypothetical protein
MSIKGALATQIGGTEADNGSLGRRAGMARLVPEALPRAIGVTPALGARGLRPGPYHRTNCER